MLLCIDSRYDKALDLVKEVVEVSDICHIYDNSEEKPFRIFKKRKTDYLYEECEDWLKEDIIALTAIHEGLKEFNLNILN